MTEAELAKALSGRTPEQFVARWLAVSEMSAALGVEALIADHEVEGALADRKLEVWQILAPHMRAGARTWSELHDALTPEEHARVENLLNGP
jgi:hypothetical protein